MKIPERFKRNKNKLYHDKNININPGIFCNFSTLLYNLTRFKFSKIKNSSFGLYLSIYYSKDWQRGLAKI